MIKIETNIKKVNDINNILTSPLLSRQALAPSTEFER